MIKIAFERALRPAQDATWDWLPPTGGPTIKATVEKLGLIFDNIELAEAVDSAPPGDMRGPSAKAVRAIVRTRDRQPARGLSASQSLRLTAWAG